MEVLECDYLVIGAGAMGMAFTDELLAQTRDYTVLLVDKRAQPGGHWNNAYPYVRLHQPSCWYGVNSMKLEKEPPRSDGNNELASGHEVLAYYQRVLQKFQESGRVRYMPMCEADEDGRCVKSLVEPGRTWEVRARKRVVDASYMKVEVPSTHTPSFGVAPGALLVPPNGLPAVARPHPGYVVIGAGKTGMDAVLWLLRHGVAPERLQWVMPRDPWMLSRAFLQPGLVAEDPMMVEKFLGPDLSAWERALCAGGEKLRAVAYGYEDSGVFLRFDKSRWPEAFQCATVSPEEFREMQRVKAGIIRMGYVREVGVERMLLDGGEVATGEGTLHVDCTADGLSKRPAVPIWGEGRITLQPLVICQQTASAAMLAWVEATWPDEDTEKNRLRPCPHPDGFADFMSDFVIECHNKTTLARSGALGYMLSKRLNTISHESKLSVARVALRLTLARAFSRPAARL